jgi:hypothetical protein
MKPAKILFIVFVGYFFAKCSGKSDERLIVNSKSFAAKQVEIDSSRYNLLINDISSENPNQTNLGKKVVDLLAQTEYLRTSDSDSFYVKINNELKEIHSELNDLTDSVPDKSITLKNWAEINARLMKFYREVRFADELEKIIYHQKEPVFCDVFLKSLIYTHVDDHIFINLIGPSALTHYHTTGGAIKLIQRTSYPETNTMILACECSDTRYLDVYIRIPHWAINPKVTHGNVKYVARPGEYCQISRKWKNGDEILVELKN